MSDTLTRYPAPLCRVVVDGKDITSLIEPRLVSIQLTDNRGLEADQLDISLSDHDGRLAIPPKGASVQLWLGWTDTGLIPKGSYTVDETEHSGAPDVLAIRARSADLREELKAKQETSWHDKTLGDVLQALAQRYSLEPVIDSQLAAVSLTHLDQANESDANLLSRLGTQYDAVATIKAGKLLFMPVGRGTSASGKALPTVTLTRAEGDQHRFLQADRGGRFTGARAYYYDTDEAEKAEVIAGGKDKLKDLRNAYPNKAAAQAAANAEWNRVQRGTASLSITLAKGRPDLIPELTYKVVGIKSEIEAIDWLGSHVRHAFTGDSFTTSLELESHLSE